MYNVWCNRCSENDTFPNDTASDLLGNQRLSGFAQMRSLTGLCAAMLIIVSSISVVSADDPDSGSTSVSEETPSRSAAAESPAGKTKIEISDLDLAELELLVGPRALSRASGMRLEKQLPRP